MPNSDLCSEAFSSNESYVKLSISLSNQNWVRNCSVSSPNGLAPIKRKFLLFFRRILRRDTKSRWLFLDFLNEEKISSKFFCFLIRCWNFVRVHLHCLQFNIKVFQERKKKVHSTNIKATNSHLSCAAKCIQKENYVNKNEKYLDLIFFSFFLILYGIILLCY